MGRNTLVDALNPDPKKLHLSHIARGIASIPRFRGQSKCNYSVATHSRWVANLAAAIAPRRRITPSVATVYALLHDAAEAVIGDIPRPIKQLFPELDAIEQRILSTIYQKLDIPEPSQEVTRLVQDADNLILYVEAERLFGGFEGWNLKPIPKDVVYYEVSRASWYWAFRKHRTIHGERQRWLFSVRDAIAKARKGGWK